MSTRTISKSSISFGLAGIDSLIDPYNLSYQAGDGSPSVACIVGPDGVGKSILGLCAASMYAATNFRDSQLRVIYASTDLNIVQAKRSFEHFGLDQPRRRRSVIRTAIESLCFDQDDEMVLKLRDDDLAIQCKLNWLSPFPDSLSQSGRGSSHPPPEPISTIFVEPDPGKKSFVHFLDLAEFSAGDDWGLLNRILGLLQSNFKPSVPHLLVIDAVEGLETMAGNVDAFGLHRSRRSRLAQLVRIARKANCNLLFIIEQKSSVVRLDEVFISDLVLRLNVTEKDGYLQKSIEVEKARSVSHVRGIHELQIRDGRGGYGEGDVPDDPRLVFNPATSSDAQPIESRLQPRVTTPVLSENKSECMNPDFGRGIMPLCEPPDDQYLGYMHVWPSLHQKPKRERESQYQIESATINRASASTAGGLQAHEPSDLFGGELSLLDKLISQSRLSKSDQVEENIIVSVGEAGTRKSTLAYAFLAEPFRNGNKGKSGAVLISSEGATYDRIKSVFKHCGAVPTSFSDQVLVRPVQPRFLSSSGFVNRIKYCIRHMKRTLRDKLKVEFVSTDIRVVIDNWNTILESHPTLASDPLLMQRVFQLLKEEGVLAYLVGTQPGSPNANTAVQRTHNIGQLEAIHIHTWPVDFFGDRRIAISSSVPGSGDRRRAIYELARDDASAFGIKILPDFDLYEDLESGKAKRVDLRVKLYSGFHKEDEKKFELDSSYNDQVSALFGDLFPSSKNGRDIVSFEDIERYDAFKEYIQNMGTSRLDETLLFQVDEFWNSDSSAPGALACMEDFLNLESKNAGPNRSRFTDGVPFGDCKIPLHKDFGLILADREAWRRAKDSQLSEYFLGQLGMKQYPMYMGLGFDYPSIPGSVFQASAKVTGQAPNVKVADVWNSLCAQGCELSDSKKISNLRPSWEMFLAACQIVAKSTGRLPFDIDMRTSESLSSLALELWFSKIQDQLLIDSLGNVPRWKKNAKSKLAEKSERFESWFATQSQIAEFSLSELIDEWNVELDYSLRILIENLPSRFREFALPLSPPSKDAVAFRSWFAPAVLCQRENPHLVPLRVPGRFSVRGDWHLGVAKASRSFLLAQNAIEKLISDSMNKKRLHGGVGLPVVKFSGSVETPLFCIDKGGIKRRINYDQLIELEPGEQPSGGVGVTRIFRSRIRGYDQDSHDFNLLIRDLLRVMVKPEWDWEENSRDPRKGFRKGRDGGPSPYKHHQGKDVTSLYTAFMNRPSLTP
ncbi:RAD55 family ATPase [Pirellulaceae bacterium SH501]